ncbi:glycogen synthase [Inconstantimicrobium mannanitabidum]|uniref:Glycogen synthase n=1 Tax=Inconstantimicrobium mannanitabidum TaxID=1604901 RepID=A0ACB5RE34_9CLOT|nr:glycogen synthase [Clostridium sp. TW13]GKX67361.1 glycogen synthase [Clostridium sp. TW13]
MKKSILFVTSQVYPFTTGTMGVFNYSLPKKLIKLGFDARVIVPRINKPYKPYPKETNDIVSLDINMSDQIYPCTVESCTYDGVPMYFINSDYFFSRDKLYGYSDEVQRFCYFCKAVLHAIPHLDFNPDILHCQDWHTGYIPVLLKTKFKGFSKSVKTLFTIHNMGYQGVFDKENCVFLDLDWDELVNCNIDYYDQINFMKAGISYADIITTVSPTYAKEIATEQYGATLDKTVKSRSNNIYGVLCGLDTEINNPAKDSRIFVNYDAYNLQGKYENKRFLQRELKFEEREDIPIISLFSRLKTEKGLDLVRSVFKDIMKADIQFVVVSDGDVMYEEFFRRAAKEYPQKFAFILYDNDFAYKAYAGSDLFLMPSSYEPCGIGQLIALRYGTVPIVHQVGGLNDSIKEYNPLTGEGNGFCFKPYNAKVMLYTIRKAIRMYHKKDDWLKVVRNGMLEDHSWDKYVEQYVDVYKQV